MNAPAQPADEAIVLTAHERSYDEAVEFEPGQSVILGDEDDEFPGWVWVIQSNGRKGWSPPFRPRVFPDTAAVSSPFCHCSG